jgi:hypothetical protein
VAGHRPAGLPDVALRVDLAQFGSGGEFIALGNVADEGVVGRGLVRDDVGGEAAFEEGGEDLCGVAEDADGEGLPVLFASSARSIAASRSSMRSSR